MDRSHPAFQRLHAAISEHAFIAQELYALIGRKVALAQLPASGEPTSETQTRMIEEINALLPEVKAQFDETQKAVDLALFEMLKAHQAELQSDAIKRTIGYDPRERPA